MAKTNYRRVRFNFAGGAGPAAIALAVSRELEWTPPVFPSTCVCCNADAEGRKDLCSASGPNGLHGSVAVPVCAACAPHAFSTNLLQALSIVLAFVGAGLVLVSWFDPAEVEGLARPILIALGVALVVISSGVFLYEAIRTAVPKDRPHHPDLEIKLTLSAAFVTTTNDTLADELLRLNPASGVASEAGNQPSPRPEN